MNLFFKEKWKFETHDRQNSVAMATLVLKYYVTMPFNFFPEKCKKNSLKLVVIACTVLKLLFKSKFGGPSNYIAIGGS